LGEFEEAEQSLRRALTLAEPIPLLLSPLAHCLYALGRPAEGRAILEEIVHSEHPAAESRVIVALTRLSLGDYAAGWPETDAQWDVRPDEAPAWSDRRWRGEALEGRTVLVHHQGGLGDSIMMARYLPLIEGRGGRVLLAVPRELASLLGRAPAVDAVVTAGVPLSIAQLHVGALSLPRVFQCTVDSIPGAGGYLRAPTPRAPLRVRDGKLHVGLAWAGGRRTLHDVDRSVPSLSLLAPLFETPGVVFHSLQVHERAGELEGFPIERPVAMPDFVCTANHMTELDLVISVDTAPAHLAGALGVPVWVPIPTVPEWRWLLDREDTPWYTSMRLFRRRDSRAWHEVAARMAEALRAMAGAAGAAW
jgi:hypothetical protein